MNEKALQQGERVVWTYWHSLNGKSRVLRAKHGVFIGLVRHTARWDGDQMAIVQFDGNKRTSRVPECDLKRESEFLEAK